MDYMQEGITKNATMLGAPGFAGGAWFVMQIYPNAPMWLIIIVGIVSFLMICGSLYYWFLLFTYPKPKQEVIDTLVDAIMTSDLVARKKITNIDEYRKEIMAWIDDLETLVRAEMDDEQADMFCTIPLVIQPDSGEDICRAAVSVRMLKLRLIMARYIRGEHVKRRPSKLSLT